jgi:pimeloyl-ACP methyl ester carboxylesterase
VRTLRESGQTFPASLILVHGAGSGPWVFQGWESSFPGLSVVAVDLHAGLLVSTASMRDYTDNIIAAAEGLPRPIALCGWSMGGLAALQAAGDLQPHSMVLIEPSPPGEYKVLTAKFGSRREYLTQKGSTADSLPRCPPARVRAGSTGTKAWRFSTVAAVPIACYLRGGVPPRARHVRRHFLRI